MPDFNAGDVVVFLGSNAWYSDCGFTVGEPYVVSATTGGWIDTVRIAVDDAGRTNNGWHREYFELARDCAAIHRKARERVPRAYGR